MIKQDYGSKNCMAVVATIAFHIPIEEFESYCNDDAGPYSINQFVRFGISRGYFTGFYCFSNPKVHFGMIIEKFDIQTMPALAVVKSAYNEGEQHAVYWDGKNIIDPDPAIQGYRNPKDYEILEWYPILKF